MAFYFDTMHNIDLSRYDFDPETNEIKIKDFDALCVWAEDQDYYTSHNSADSYVRITRTDKKGIIIHQQMVQFPLDAYPDLILLGFNSKRSLLGAKEPYRIPYEGEVEVPVRNQEKEDPVPKPILEGFKEEVPEQPTVEKTEATQMLEILMAQKEVEVHVEEEPVPTKPLSDVERHERVTNLAAGMETDDYRSEVTEDDVPDVLVENQDHAREFTLKSQAEWSEPVTASEEPQDEVERTTILSEPSDDLEIEESVASFKYHLDGIIKAHEKEIKRATASANDLISSFVALGSGLMDGAITYDQLGREMANKGQEIQNIGQHIANQEKKIAKIASLNKEIDKVLQTEE